MTERPVLLDIRDLHVWFRVYEGLSKVLDGVSLHVREAERVGLVGETGCGKTVAMKAAMGTLKSPPALFPAGEVLLTGKDVLKMSPAEILNMKGKTIAMIFQDPLLQWKRWPPSDCRIRNVCSSRILLSSLVECASAHSLQWRS